MATNQLKGVLQTLRRATAERDEEALTDGQLLASYVRSREEAAFSALVQRHGPMVWGVCRRLLRCHQDAEDAFQATFLVLVRRAAAVVPREKVANWLYGVAHQTALYARATAARRSTREKQVPAMPEPATRQQEPTDDLSALLDQELSRLPDKYREVIVLCDLEGKTRKEAARQFALPEGTVASRLATARTLLARRLGRQGLGMSGGALAAVLAQGVAPASVPTSVTSTTIKAASLFAAGQAAAGGVLSVNAVALAEGVLKTMLLTKLKIATALLLAFVVVGAGAVVLTQRVLAERTADPRVPEKQVLAPRPAEQPVKAKAVVAGVQAVNEKAAKIDPAPAAPAGGCGGDGAMVKAVDVENRTITFDEKAPAEVAGKTFRVAEKANIAIDGKPGKLLDLPAGAFLRLGLSADRQTILHFDARGPELSCFEVAGVEAVDVEKGTITLDAKAPALVAGKTFAVAQDTRIQIDGKPGKLADLPPAALVHLGLSADRKTILHFTARGPELNCFEPGRVEAVDAEKGTVTFDDRAPALVLGKTFPVAGDARIEIDGKPGKLADLPAGAFLCVRLTVDRKTIVHLSALGPQVNDCNGSEVKAVDVQNGTITFDDKARAEVAGKTFRVAPDANISIDGKRGKLAELPAGAFVNLTLAVDHKTILHLSAQGPQVNDCNGSEVKAVDAENGTISFGDKTRAELAGKTFAVAPDANINIDGKRCKLAELPAGAFINLGLAVDRKTVRWINASGHQVSDCNGSEVKAVDAGHGTISFGDKVRAELAGKTFSVAPDANINIDGKQGKLADLPAGAFINLGFAVDRKTVRWINAQGPQVNDCNGSEVKAVDAENGTISFGDKVRAEVAGKTWTVAKDANISIDGKRGKLAELPAGAFVNLTFAVDRKTVRHIQAQGPQVGGHEAAPVKAVDAGKGTITFDGKAPALVAGKTFAVARDARIEVDGKRSQLADVPAGALLTLGLSVDRKTIVYCNAQGPQVR